jgi:APA family basic amino acid/polyamine antiporter
MFKFFGTFGKNLLSFIVVIICIGTINAWFISSSLTAYENAKTNIFPKFLTYKNQFDSPIYASLVSNIPLIFIFFLTNNGLAGDSINHLLDLSTNVFIFFYFFSLLTIFKLTKDKYVLFATILCFVIFLMGNILIPIILLLSGIPVYFLMNKIKKK